jgi:hypothetical protein
VLSMSTGLALPKDSISMKIFDVSMVAAFLSPSRTFGTENIIHHITQDLARHTSTLLDRSHNLARNLRGQALEVDGIAIGELGHGSGGVDVRAVGGDGVDGR